MDNSLIKRQDAIDAIVAWTVEDRPDAEMPTDLIDRIHDLPSAQPERKKGEWIDDNCSECGQYVYHGDMRRYCPRCGADMRGDEDDTD